MSVAAPALEMTRVNPGAPLPAKPDDKIEKSLVEELIEETYRIANNFAHHHQQLEIEVSEYSTKSPKEDLEKIRNAFKAIIEIELMSRFTGELLKLQRDISSAIKNCPVILGPIQGGSEFSKLEVAPFLENVSQNLTTSQTARKEQFKRLAAPSNGASSTSAAPASSAPARPIFYHLKIPGRAPAALSAPAGPAPNAAGSASKK